MREPPNIPEERLRACLQSEYAVFPVTLEFLPKGKDYYAGVYRVVSDQGTPYFLKVRSGSFYEPSCLVPSYLRNLGITAVVAPIPTKNHVLWTKLGDWTVIVYPFIEGDTSWTGMTSGQWKETGTVFKQIHQVRLPQAGFESVRKETFDPTAYVEWVRAFESQHLTSQEDGSIVKRALRASWIAHQSTIDTIVTSLEKLAVMLQARTFDHVICHADLHASNLLRDSAGHVYVIDWDDVMLAPKERDFIFVREPHAQAFEQGYGNPEIDWTALTYYRWERVVQDLIEYAKQAWFRDDWGEESKMELAQLFHENLEEGLNLMAAYSATAHLPKDSTCPP